MNKPERPIPESYWVEPGQLLAGEYPGKNDTEATRKRLDALIQAGFNTFIDLTKPNEAMPYFPVLMEEARFYDVEVNHLRFPIGDFGLPAPEQMTSILNTIDAELQAGRRIYLHCWGGIGRTGTTVGCYLVRRGKTGEEALRQLAEWWQGVPKSQIHQRSPETLEQVEFIRNWSAHEIKPETSWWRISLQHINSILRMDKSIAKGSIIFSGAIHKLETTQLEPQVQPEAQPEQKEDWKRFILDILETLILAVVLYFGINALSARVRVDGFSMIPTLQNGEYILVNRLAYKTGQPNRGDIIVFRLPGDETQDLIKRVIGLPGDTVHVSDGVVTINGARLEEPYIAQDPLYFGEWTIPEDYLFVLGDNRNDSRDSHQWGLLPLENVIGKSVLIYWPPDDWKIINHTEEVLKTQ